MEESSVSKVGPQTPRGLYIVGLIIRILRYNNWPKAAIMSVMNTLLICLPLASVIYCSSNASYLWYTV